MEYKKKVIKNKEFTGTKVNVKYNKICLGAHGCLWELVPGGCVTGGAWPNRH